MFYLLRKIGRESDVDGRVVIEEHLPAGAGHGGVESVGSRHGNVLVAVLALGDVDTVDKNVVRIGLKEYFAGESADTQLLLATIAGAVVFLLVDGQLDARTIVAFQRLKWAHYIRVLCGCKVEREAYLDQRVFALASVAVSLSIESTILAVADDRASAEANFLAASPFAVFAGAER